MKTADDVIDWLEEILDAPTEVTHREAQRIAKALRLLKAWEDAEIDARHGIGPHEAQQLLIQIRDAMEGSDENT